MAILQGARASQATAAPFIDQETVKAVSQTLDQSKLIIINCGKCSSYSKDVDVKLNESSRHVYRCTVRELGKQSKVKNVKRDREPSRIPVKRLFQNMKKRQIRQKYKKILLKSIPMSSKIYYLLKKYKLWYVNYVRRRDCFFTKYFRFQSQSLCTCNNAGNFAHDQYCVSKTMLLMSGDVELNPGPSTYEKSYVVRAPAISILELRLDQFGLKPLDVGGSGDCFFRAVSHQLYGNPNSHGIIRVAGVELLRENPERFIESNFEHSSIQYLVSMSRQGTWADNIIIQAVADVFNLKILIIESHPDFAEITIVEGVTAAPVQEQCAIFIGLWMNFIMCQQNL